MMSSQQVVPPVRVRLASQSATTTVLRRLYPTSLLLRTFHRNCAVSRKQDLLNPVLHGTEHYFVDGDDTPPPSASVYTVDASSGAAESAHEPPSGPWTRAGAGTDEYRTVSKDEPYDVPNSPDMKLRYGGMKGYTEERGPGRSNVGEGPEGSGRWGQKPEGRA